MTKLQFAILILCLSSCDPGDMRADGPGFVNTPETVVFASRATPFATIDERGNVTCTFGPCEKTFEDLLRVVDYYKRVQWCLKPSGTPVVNE